MSCFLSISKLEIFQDVLALPSTPALQPNSGNLDKRYTREEIVNVLNDAWTTEVSIGGQKMNLLVDTGSSDLWVFSPEVKDPGNHSFYDWTKSPGAEKLYHYSSPTATPVLETFNITYAFSDSTVSGYIVAEPNVNVGAAITPMPVGVAQVVGGGFKSWEGIDGILGLGFRSHNHVVPFPMDSLMGWLMLPKAHPTNDDTPTLAVFTVDFNPAKGSRSPTVEIGKIDRTKAAGNLGHAPVSNRTTAKWTVDDISWSVNGQTITTKVNGHPTNYTQSMLFDTGGSGIVDVDLAVARGYYAHIANHKEHSDGTFSYPCTAALPDLTLSFGNGTASYPGKMFNGSVAPDGSYCNGTLIGTTGEPFGNVGAAFFQSHYVVFEYDEPSILWAPFAS